MKQYPLITVPKGQFIVIDGFLIKLGVEEKEPNESFLKDARNLLTFDGWNILRNPYYPNSLMKLKEIRSNFYLNDNQTFFKLMCNKVISVIFIKNQGRFYCRRVDYSKSTHKALSIKVGDRNQKIKYIVYTKPTNRIEYSTDELYTQQNKDLEEIRPILLRNQLPGKAEIDTGNPILENLMFISDAQLNKLKRYPIKKAHLRRIDREEEEKKLATLWELKRKLLLICLESSFWQLEKLKSKCHRRELKSKFEDCKSQIKTNMLAISDIYFPLLIRSWFATFPRLEEIHEKYGIVDGFLVDLSTRSIADPDTIAFSSEEKEFLKCKNLVDWKVLKLSPQVAIPIHNALLFAHVKWEIKQISIDSRGHLTAQDVTVANPNMTEARCISINLKEFGIKYLYESKDGKVCPHEREIPPQTFKPPEDVGDKRHNKLMRNLGFFVSYSGLRTLYIKTFEQFNSMHSNTC